MRAPRAASTLLAVALLSGCASSLREHTTPFPPGTPRAVPWTLNRELLLPVNRRIQIVVEWTAGHAPERAALDALTKVAARYGERPATWIAGPLRADTPLEPSTTYVLVRYVGERLGHYFGYSHVELRGGRRLYVIEVNQERHRPWRVFIPERHLEAQTLVHEYGHMLGLPPEDHGYFRNFPSFLDGAHCVNPDCALTRPRFRTLVYGLWHVIFAHHYLEDYCAQCREAIAEAKRWWRSTV
jgi:hypothetical protein